MTLNPYKLTSSAMVLMSVLVAGCSTETDSMEITDQQSLTLVRRQILPWKQVYDRELVVASLPLCTRRYDLDRDEGGNEALEVYPMEGSQYILKDKNGAWLANLTDCTLTRSTSIPPGERIGVFEYKGQVLRFTRVKPQNPEKQ